eukprot:gene7011-11176_t
MKRILLTLTLIIISQVLSIPVDDANCPPPQSVGDCDWNFQETDWNYDRETIYTGCYDPSNPEYQLGGRNGSPMDNSVFDGLQFSYLPKTGDGEFITNYDSDGGGQGPLTYFGPMVRETITAGSRTAMFAYPYDYSDEHYSAFFYRNTADTAISRTGVTKRDRMFDNDYFPYTKLKRVGNTITAYVSDDMIFWSEYSSHTFTNLPTTLYWGLAYNSRSTGGFFSTKSVKFKPLIFSGFSECSSTQQCSYTARKSNCVNKDVFQTCGSNQWGKRILSNTLTNQIGGFLPTITISSTQLSLRTKLQNDFTINRDDDTFLFAFKEASGDGSISALVDSFVGTASDNTYAGVVIRANLENFDGGGTNIVMCNVPRKGSRVQMKWRPETGQGLFSSFTDDGVSGNTDYSGSTKYTVQIIKNGDSITCRHKNSADPTWITVSTKNVPMSSSFYVGVALNSDSQTPQAVLKDISIEGFSGFCSNHGNCTTVGGQLDKCACDDGWTGDQCQYPICFGIAATEPSVCSSHGNCTQPDTCVCSSGWTGSKCEIPICYGYNATDSRVCFGRGNCTYPDTCACPVEYHTDCGKSYLYDFFVELCNTSISCNLNSTAWRICTIEYAHCYCDPINSLINNENTEITCDDSKRIKSIKINNGGLKGNLPSLTNLTSMEYLDLSQNQVQSNNFLNLILPSTLKYFNFSKNGLNNIGEYYDIIKSYFNSFNQIVSEENGECGVYPETWLSNSFLVSLNNHLPSFWCSNLNSKYCHKLQLIPKLTILPHETKIIANYSTTVSGNCQNYYFSKPELLCESTNGTALKRSTSIFGKNAPQLQFVECTRNDLLSDIDQKIRLIWNYNSTLQEIISTDIEIVNLPYVNLLKFDRHLFFSNGSGGTLDVSLMYDQNLTRYKKSLADVLQCKIENYFKDVVHQSNDDFTIVCSINLNVPNTGTKSIILYENEKLHAISNTPYSFWIIDLKVTPVNIYAKNGIALSDTDGNLLPGLKGYTYQLNNTQFNLKYTCVAPSGSIQSCIQETQGNYLKDLKIIPLEFSDGNVSIHTVDTLFYRKNRIDLFVPQAIPIGEVSDVLITFNSSTFETDLVNIQYFCVFESKNVTATVMNVTTIRCNSVGHSVKKYSKIDVAFEYGHHAGVINSVDNFYFIGENMIYPSTSITNSPGFLRFNFSFLDELKPSLQDSVECQFDDGTIFNAKPISTYEYECDFASTTTKNLTFWYKNYVGKRTKLSSNFISLYFMNFTLSYDSTSKQFGNTMIKYNSTLMFEDEPVPETIKENIFCSFDNKTGDTYHLGSRKYLCTVVSDIAGFKKISMKLNQINPFKVQNIHNTFSKKFDISFNNSIAVIKKIEWIKDTTTLITEGKLKNDCSDIVVTFNEIEIGRRVENCNSVNTKVTFLTQDITKGVVNAYSLFLGNPIAIGNDSFVDGGELIQLFSYLEVNDVISISKNTLEFGLFKKFSVLNVQPYFVVGRSSNVTIQSNYEVINFNNNIDFYVEHSTLNYSAKLNGNTFFATLNSVSQAKLNLKILVIYKPTGERVDGSIDTFEFFFMDPINMKYLYPFVEGFTFSNKNTRVILNTNENLLTDKGLLCQYCLNTDTQYFEAKFVGGNTKIVDCNITAAGLLKTSELVHISLYMNQSLDTYIKLSSHNLTLVYMKEPISINLNPVINKYLFGQNFDLEFTDPLSLDLKLSYSNFKVKATVENSLNSNFISCQNGISKPQCVIDNLTVDKTPSKIDFQMQFNSTFFSENINLKMTSHYFRENITFLTEFPFIANSKNSSLKINFNVSQNLHQNYSYYCRVFGVDYEIIRDSVEYSSFSCSFLTKNELYANISLYINGSSIIGMDGIISNEDSMIELTQLKLQVGYSRDVDNSSHTISRSIDSSPIFLNQKYRNLQYRIVSNDGISYIYGCKVLESGSIECVKNSLFNPTFDINLIYFELEYKTENTGLWKKLIDVNRGLVSYEKHVIVSISPVAALVHSSLNVTINFGSSTLNLDTFLSNHLELHCSDQRNLFNGLKKSTTSFLCDIQYENSNLIQIDVSFTVPKFDIGLNVSLSTNTYPFYFLTQSEINLKSESDRRLFVSDEFATFNINTTNFIPSSALEFIKGKFNESSGFVGATNLVYSNGNDYTFYFNASLQKGGLYPLSLWYDDGNYKFQLSNNTIDVVFIKIAKILGSSPTVAIVNQTSVLNIQTSFDTSFDYGNNTSFICKYGPSGAPFGNFTKATVGFLKGTFDCNVISDSIGTYYISVWIVAVGVEKKITDENLAFRIVTTNYLSPSYGIAAGNENTTMNTYYGIPTNITFNQTSLEKYVFICTSVSFQLNCVTPTISTSDLIPYSSYQLKFTQTSVKFSIKWVVYEKRNISDFYPKVVSAFTSSFNLSIHLKETKLIQEGSFYLVIDPKKSEELRSDLGQLKNELNSTVLISKSLTAGSHFLELFYFNSELVEFKSMIPISSKEVLTVLKRSTISFASNSENVLYLNEFKNITISLDNDVNMLSYHLPKVKCKIGDVFVDTYFDASKPTQYSCTAFSSTKKIDFFSLWYKNEDAVDGEILISSTKLPILFIENFNITSVSPFASVEENTTISIDSTFTDIYGSHATYSCEFNGKSYPANYVNSKFQCSLSKDTSNSYFDHVKLNITSPITKHSVVISKNKEENSRFYFLSKTKMNSIHPFLKTHNSVGKKLDTTIQLSLKENLILERGLVCNFGDALFSVATYFNGNKNVLECEISKQNLGSVDILDITLWINTTKTLFQLSSNNETYLFIKEPMLWKDLQNSFDSRFNPSINFEKELPDTFEYQLQLSYPKQNVVSNVSCDFSGVPICQPNFTELAMINTIPANISFKMYVTHKFTKIVSSFDLENLAYFRDIAIQHLKPFIVNSFTTKYSPVRIIANIFENELNSLEYSYKCNISNHNEYRLFDSKFDVSSTEYQPILPEKSHFACDFISFGDADTDYYVTLVLAIGNKNYELTSVPAVIHSISSLELLTTSGVSTGNYNISVNLNFKNPTNIYSSYNHTISVKNNENYVNLGTCEMIKTFLHCYVNSIVNLFSTWKDSRKLRLIMFTDNSKSIELNPYFTFYPEIKIIKVSPSTYAPTNAIGDFEFFLTSFEFFEKISIKYVMNNLEIEHNCTLISLKILKCGVPSFKTIGVASIFLSLTSGQYQKLNGNITIYSPSTFSFQNALPNLLSFVDKNTLFIAGTNFINTNYIKIKIYDGLINLVVDGVFVNSTHLKTSVDSLFYYDGIYPRTLNADVSFDGGLQYLTNSISLKIDNWNEVEISPNLIALNEISKGITIKHFPKEIYYNSSDYILEYFLWMNQTNFLKMNCFNEGNLICNLTKIPKIIGHYEFKVILVDKIGTWNQVNIFSSNKMYIYPILSIELVEPKMLVLGTENPIKFKGNFTSSLFKTAIFRFIWNSDTVLLSSFDNTTTLVLAELTENELSVSLPKRSGLKNVEVTFNGINFHPLNQFDSIIKNYQLNYVINTNTKDNYFLTFESSPGKIEGVDFPAGNNTKLILRFDTNNILDITTLSNLEYVSDKEMNFRFPSFTEITAPYQLRYPLELQVGLSFNGGYDFRYSSVVYLNTYRQSTFTGISPQIVPQDTDIDVSIFGINLHFFDRCVFYAPGFVSPGKEIHISNKTIATEKNSTICSIPASKTKGYSILIISILNPQSNLNEKGFELSFYEIPKFVNFIPNSGVSSGGFPITITGVNVSKVIDNPYCKFGNILCEKRCTYSQGSINCITQSHPAAKVNVEISYNGEHWHGVQNSNITKFEFTPCLAGYSSNSYREGCSLCPPGTYKQIGGLFDCIPCEEDHFTSFSGSIQCEKCPANTTTDGIKGSSSHTACVCNIGFYVNPTKDSTSGAFGKCIECPTGAECNSKNMTIPLAKYGYWRSADNHQLFYSCLPERSCGGYGAENCTIGYSGPRCGLKVLFDLHQFGKGDFHQHDNMFGNFEVPWDTDFQYKPVSFQTDSESEEDNYTNMNEIFGDLLSRRRLEKNLFSLKKKTYKASMIIIKKIKKKDKSNIDKHINEMNTYDSTIWDQKDLDRIQNFEKNVGREMINIVSNTKTGSRVKSLLHPEEMSSRQRDIINDSRSSVRHVKSKKLTVKKSMVEDAATMVELKNASTDEKRNSSKDENRRKSKQKIPSTDLDIEVVKK